MKKILIFTIYALVFTAAMTSCRKNFIRGEGDTIIETRTLVGFTSVHSNSDIRIYVSYGPIQNVEVKGYSNLVAITETNVANGKLIINYKDQYFNVRNSNIEVFITIPVLTAVSSNGSGNGAVHGFLNGGNLDIFINGSSDISITNSNYTGTRMEINGSGNIKAAGLLAKNTDATIHGSGDIEVSCSQVLKVRIAGSGDVKYWGNPSLDVQVSGSGTVKQQ